MKEPAGGGQVPSSWSADGRPPGEPLARGRTAEVYPWTGDQVLKLFHPWMDGGAVERERRNAAAARQAGVPAPAVGGMVRCGERVGLVFERIDGPTAMELLTFEPDAVQTAARALAELHLSLHRVLAPDDLPRQAQILESRLAGCDLLSPGERDGLLARLRRMPPEATFCHGDFHPGNILQTPRGPVIIDWIDASCGWALADVARSSVLFLGHLETPGLGAEVRAAIQLYHDTYLEQYFQARTVDPEGLAAWVPIRAGARLREDIPELREWLLAQVRASRLAGGGTS
ncbi:MAG: aminoglycoside phosphotransferase family protein [Gemmatimonadota bacterium]